VPYANKDWWVLVDGEDLSEYVTNVSVARAADDLDVSTMGAGVHQALGGLRTDSFAITFLPDPEGIVRGVLEPLLVTADTQQSFAVFAAPFGDTVSATNPAYTSAACILLDLPDGGEIGTRAEMAVTIRSNALITSVTTYTPGP
jgi:hypothetical protein